MDFRDDWLKQAEEEMFRRCRRSAMSLTLFSGKVDAKICVELGAAILFDKPLLIVALKGSSIPVNLYKVATEIVEVDSMDDPKAKQKVSAAISRVLRKQ